MAIEGNIVSEMYIKENEEKVKRERGEVDVCCSRLK